MRLGADPAAWLGWDEAGRLLALAANTAWLVGGTLLLALPAGVAAAVLLYRTDMPLKRLFRFLVLLTLFIPLPLFATGWQAVLGSGGWLPVGLWNAPRSAAFGPDSGVWTPWGQGLVSAVWIQAVAGLPWVILLAGQGFLGVERSLEEDAWTVLPAWQVLVRVSLPRAGAAIAAAALWVGLQAAGEITVTDVMQVRSLCRGGATRSSSCRRPAAATRSRRGGGHAASRRARRCPDPRAGPPLGPPPSRGRGRDTAGPDISAGALALAAGTAARDGGTGAPGRPHGQPGVAGRAPRCAASWSGAVVLEHLKVMWPAEYPHLRNSLLLAAGAEVSCAILGLMACWAAAGTRWFRAGVLVLMALAWSVPGPVIGLGLKDTIAGLLNLVVPPAPPDGGTGLKEDGAMPWQHPLARALYYGPSPVPLWWVDVIRFFPCAVALLWPVVRLIPAELRDAARTDGATAWGELRHVVWPRAASACGRAALAAGVLSLGELRRGQAGPDPGHAVLCRGHLHADALRGHQRSRGSLPAAARRRGGRRPGPGLARQENAAGRVGLDGSRRLPGRFCPPPDCAAARPQGRGFPCSNAAATR